MLLPITLTLAAACALLNFWLAMRCARIRVGQKVLHGDGGNPLLGRRIRAHANFIEYAPIVLILSTLVEMALGASIWLWTAALALILGLVPLVFASGPGSASRQGIGTGVFFGMLVAITVGIVFVPLFFVWVYKLKEKWTTR